MKPAPKLSKVSNALYVNELVTNSRKKALLVPKLLWIPNHPYPVNEAT